MLVLKINYTKTLVQASKSVRYHAFRSRELPTDRMGAFDRHSGRANVGAFIKSLDDPLTRDRKTRSGTLIQPAKMHRLMFSLRRKDFEACGFTSWKPVIREALESFEKQHHIKLEWIAAEHLNETHPHVHVDVKSVYTHADGSRHRLRITHEMRVQLKAAVDAVIEREHKAREEERRQERACRQAVHDVALTLLRGLRDAGREDDRETDSLANRQKRRRPEPDRDSDDRGR